MIYSTVITNGVMESNMAITQEGPETAVPLAAKTGYNALQLTVQTKDDYDWPRLKELLKENGIFIHALATGRIYSVEGYSMGSGEEENRRACVERLCEMVDICQDLGANLIIGNVRGRTTDAATPQLYHQQFAKSLAQVCDYAAPKKVQVLLELINHNDSDCCNRLPEMLDYLKRLDRENLHMYLDVMHLYYEDQDICAVLRDYAGGVPQVDISGEERVSPMDSVIDYPAAMKVLKETGFDGIVNLEFDVSKGENLSAKALSYIRGLLE